MQLGQIVAYTQAGSRGCLCKRSDCRGDTHGRFIENGSFYAVIQHTGPKFFYFTGFSRNKSVKSKGGKVKAGDGGGRYRSTSSANGNYFNAGGGGGFHKNTAGIRNTGSAGVGNQGDLAAVVQFIQQFLHTGTFVEFVVGNQFAVNAEFGKQRPGGAGIFGRYDISRF